MLLLPPERLAERRAVAAGPLAPLARGLASELEPLLGRDVFVPREKARMTRAGGRCAADGAMLDFDPWSPRRHRCPRCGAEYARDEDYRWWIMSYHLWLAERAVHGALLHLLGGDVRHARVADDILASCAEQYLQWPNVDNVLGPTRPFFSTYLESIWLLQLCVALDLREAAEGPSALGGLVRERLIEPSRALIRSYDEELANRQTWNDAALLAAALACGDRAAAEEAVHSASGVVLHLERGLLVDGSWYEGENYHLFAHRALWYGVTMAERAAIELPETLRARFGEGFVTPFVTALPDFTFPSRRDAQYGVSLRQWRFAELCELGLARGDDARLASALGRLYAGDLPRGDSGRARSTADVEKNLPPTALGRADLGWKSLLLARGDLPPLAPRAERSALLAGQGLAIVRRDEGRVYVALDYGHSGGGHGHPDRLNLLLVDGATRWLDDMGTGSYVDPSLHWYRSTLAHDAPLVNGRSQERVHGVLRAWEDRGGAGWVWAETDGIAPGAHVERTVIVMPDYLVDLLEWRDAGSVVIDLPIHADGEVAGAADWEPFDPRGGDGLEDGFRFPERVERARIDRPVVRLEAREGDARASAWVASPAPFTLWRATAPGAPGKGARRFHVVRSGEDAGRIVTVWSWRGAVTGATLDGDTIVVMLADGARHLHGRVAHGWHVDLLAGGARSSIDLEGLVTTSDSRRETADERGETRKGTERLVRVLPRSSAVDHAEADSKSGAEPIVIPRTLEGGVAFVAMELGEAHYRRSEETWAEAGSPTARVSVGASADALRVWVDVRKRELAFAPERAENPLDNEHPDVNSDGVQLHLAVGDATRGWVLVPEEKGERARVTPTAGTPATLRPEAHWRRTATGYLVSVSLPLGALGLDATDGRFALDVIVNETAPGRERRRGQLVLSGARGEWVYLRGDRQSVDRLIPFVLSDV